MKPFDEKTPELGRTLAYVSRYWRPAIPHAVCPFCGRKFYHIIEHLGECELRPPATPGFDKPAEMDIIRVAEG